MKTIKSLYKLAATAALLTGFAINFNACTEQSPLQHSETGKKLNFLSLDDLPFLDKGDGRSPEGRTVSTTVTRRAGGRLRMAFQKRAELVEFENTTAVVTLDILPHSVNNRTEISLTARMMKAIVFGNIDMEYAPHGLVFNRPAILNIRGENLDLSELDPAIIDRFGLYYIDQETGQWEEMETDEIYINIATGVIRIVKARLPHFSRYALAWSN